MSSLVSTVAFEFDIRQLRAAVPRSDCNALAESAITPQRVRTSLRALRRGSRICIPGFAMWTTVQLMAYLPTSFSRFFYREFGRFFYRA